MKSRIRAMLAWELRDRAFALLAPPTFAFAAGFTLRVWSLYERGLRTDGDTGEFLIILFSMTVVPFVAASAFASEEEAAGGRFWELIPVTRTSRWLVKWLVIGVGLPVTMVASSAAMSFGLFLDPIPTDSEGELLFAAPLWWWMLGLFMLGGATGGTVARRTFAGGFLGACLGISMIILGAHAIDLMRNGGQGNTLSVLAWIVTGFALPPAILWGQYTHFRDEDETRGRVYPAWVFLPRFLGLAALAGLAAPIWIRQNGGYAFEFLPAARFALGGLILLPLLFGALAGVFLAPRERASSRFWGAGLLLYAVLVAAAALIARLSLLGRAGAIFGILLFVTIAWIGTYFVLSRIGRIRPAPAFFLAGGLALLPIGGLVLGIDWAIGSSFAKSVAGLLLVGSVVALYERLGRSEIGPIHRVAASLAGAILLVASLYAVAASAWWVADGWRPHAKPAGLLRFEPSTDQIARGRAEALFRLANDVFVPRRGEAPAETEIVLPEWRDGGYDAPETEVVRLLDRARPNRERFRAIISSGPLAYPYPDSITIFTPLPHFGKVIALARAEVWEARRLLREGDERGAAERIAFVIEAGRKMRDAEGPFIHYYISLAVINIGTEAAGVWLHATESDLGDPSPIRDATLAALATDSGLRPSLTSEYAYFESALDYMLDFGSDTPLKSDFLPGSERRDFSTWLQPLEATAIALSFDREPLLARHEAYLSGIARLGEVPYYEAETGLLRLDREFAVPHPPSFWKTPRNLVGEILYGISAPIFSSILTTRAECHASLSALRAACEVRAARRRGSNPAAAWNAMQESLRRDPLTEREFARTDTGVEIKTSQSQKRLVFAW